MTTARRQPTLDFIQEFQHLAILVSDLERSKRWYGEVLGWQEEWTQSMSSDLGDLNGFTGRGGEITMGDICGVRVEFVQMHTDEPLPAWRCSDHYGMFLLSVRVTDLDATREHCRSLGVDIVRERVIGESTTLIVRDPDGQEVAFVGRRPELR